MKNFFAFILIAAAVVVAYMFYKRKKTTEAPITQPINQPITKVIQGLPVLTNFKPNADIDWTSLSNKIKAVGGTCASLPPEEREKCMQRGLSAFSGNGALELFTGNGSLELFTGNSALEYFTGLPGVIIPAKKPTCFSIWQHNISNPNGPALPMWPGLNCRNSAI